MAERVGGKILFGGGILASALVTLLMPVAARFSVYMLIALRVLQGIVEGVTFPSMHALWSCWIPPVERSRVVSFSYSGIQLVLSLQCHCLVFCVIMALLVAGLQHSTCLVLLVVCGLWLGLCCAIILRLLIRAYHWLNFATLRYRWNFVRHLESHQFRRQRLQLRYQSGLVLPLILHTIGDSTRC